MPLPTTRAKEEEDLKRQQEKAKKRREEYAEMIEKERTSKPIMGLRDNDGW